MSDFVGGIGEGYGRIGGFGSTGAILVLFILLVIISKAFII
ncbi:dihydroorotate dehydrogenase [Paenibacillus macquariensis]|uniref:Dihydroorotate dehydrogenase n=1 Tax=Paenibacillus macquariensis TaxID=948756 RepID=A0ABY1KF08_9BACL|nr:dihydroorotate dehydrogenase [Paenibacillus macquariensis]MEC0094369.1 YjcZ family sporulation protein [Paenibacillus macquariensis]OAB34970.1 dihydroorotate dehydrogenase [Paenibacillus macquariensis subsp. macquariensis]SIR73760.1 hypothetical protein SAMN05421578_1542 [Paenibacillus macquariensis]